MRGTDSADVTDTANDSSPGDGGRITIDLDALAANWRALDARLSDDAECGAAVKADCYGLGSDDGLAALWTAGSTPVGMCVCGGAGGR